MLAAVFDAKADFYKKYPHLPRTNREWSRVVATEIMQLSGVIYVCKFGTFEENVTTFLTFPLKIPILHTHYP